MTVDIARTEDIRAICEFGKNYKEKEELFPDSEFKERDFKTFLLSAIVGTGTKVFIYRSGEEVSGFLIMSIDVVPWNRNEKWASDVLFAAEKGGASLLRTGILWAKKHRCWKIFFSNSTSKDKADKFFRAFGLRYTGGHYEFC